MRDKNEKDYSRATLELNKFRLPQSIWWICIADIFSFRPFWRLRTVANKARCTNYDSIALRKSTILCGNFKRAAMRYPCRLRLLSWWGALLAYYSLHRVVLKVIPYIFRIFGHSAPKLTIVGRYLSSSVILQRNCIPVVHHLEIVRVHCLLKHIN